MDCFIPALSDGPLTSFTSAVDKGDTGAAGGLANHCNLVQSLVLAAIDTYKTTRVDTDPSGGSE